MSLIRFFLTGPPAAKPSARTFAVATVALNWRPKGAQLICALPLFVAVPHQPGLPPQHPPHMVATSLAPAAKHRPQDPARALRQAVRHFDESKLSRLIEWLLNGVPLMWDAKFALVRCRVIRGLVAPGDDGFAFGLNEATGLVTEVRRQEEVAEMGKGDRVVTVDGTPLEESQLNEVEPESVVELGVWKKKDMAQLRRRLAQRPLDDAVLEVARLDCGEAGTAEYLRREAVAANMLSLLLKQGASCKAKDGSGIG